MTFELEEYISNIHIIRVYLKKTHSSFDFSIHLNCTTDILTLRKCGFPYICEKMSCLLIIWKWLLVKDLISKFSFCFLVDNSCCAGNASFPKLVACVFFVVGCIIAIHHGKIACKSITSAPM